MKKIGIIGAAGFVGSALCRAAQKNDLHFVPITRQSYEEESQQQYDVLINTCMPSKRFWALNNPLLDIEATVVRTAEIFYEWHYKKFIQISSLSARIQSDIPYGAHKKAAESIVVSDPNSLVVRLGALYGTGLDKSALFDLIQHNHIYVDIDSEYNYINIDTAASWIINNLDKKGVKEIGACDTISLKDISKGVWENPSYEGRLEKIYSDRVEDNMPSAKLVLDYIKEIK